MEVYLLLLFFVSSIIGITEYMQYKQKYIFTKEKIRSYRYKFWRNFSFITIFLLLAFFSSIRDGIGIDYDSYMMHIHNIQLSEPNYMEEGFKSVVRFLGSIDSNPRLVIIAFAIGTCFFYVNAIYDQSSDILMSLFIFLSWGYYFLTFTTIRNYFALSVALYSIKYINKKKYLHFLVLILIAATIHKSALICIPVYLLANCKYNIDTLKLLLFSPAFFIMMKRLIRWIVFKVYPGYLGSVYDVGRVSYINILKALIVVSLGFIFFEKFKGDKVCRLYFHLNIFALIYYFGFYWMPEVSRIGFYMNVTSIIFIPNLISKVELKRNKDVLKSGIYMFSFIFFFLLMYQFYSPTTKLLPYKTWLFKSTY